MGTTPSKPASVEHVDDNEKRRASSSTMATCSPLSPSGALTLDNISSWEQEISADPRAQLARTYVLTRFDHPKRLIEHIIQRIRYCGYQGLAAVPVCDDLGHTRLQH